MEVLFGFHFCRTVLRPRAAESGPKTELLGVVLDLGTSGTKAFEHAHPRRRGVAYSAPITSCQKRKQMCPREAPFHPNCGVSIVIPGEGGFTEAGSLGGRAGGGDLRTGLGFLYPAGALFALGPPDGVPRLGPPLSGWLQAAVGTE